jgi:hypothetical protein
MLDQIFSLGFVSSPYTTCHAELVTLLKLGVRGGCEGEGRKREGKGGERVGVKQAGGGTSKGRGEG